MITLTPKHGYGPDCYVVRYLSDFDQIRRWMHENGVDYWHVSSGPEGTGFQVTSNVEWFKLKWL